MKKIGYALMVGAVLALPSQSQAADLPMAAPEILAAPMVDTGGAFYLRGDLGYTMYQGLEAVYNKEGSPYTDFFNEDLDDTFLFGVGAGYSFNDHFRVDLTVDYRFDSDFYGQFTCGCGTSEGNASMNVWTALANAYLDLGNFEGFTPYVGAGVGFAGIKWNNIILDYASGTPAQAVIAGKTTLNFALAAMAGVSYDIAQNVKLDLNYRYLMLGDAKSAFDVVNKRMSYDDLAAHEVRLGLRYLFN